MKSANLNILVTGGAGYIGSVLTEHLINEGYSTVIVDNLSRGHKEAIHPEANFFHCDIGDIRALTEVFKQQHIDAVMHMAAEIQVGESMIKPENYFHTNIVCGLNLLNVMLQNKVDKIIFSSTAATYGNPQSIPIKETDCQLPTNPYGESKLAFERILKWYSNAHGISYIALRYFNAAGASKNYGCDHENEPLLIPNLIMVALGQKKYISIFGNDYPTRDGTCIRDYIHVSDISKAHILALRYIMKNKAGSYINLGNGKGYSVFEVIEAVKKVTGVDIPSVICNRREGDPPQLVADSRTAKQILGWKPEYADLETIIESAWKWQKKHPYGYRVDR